MQTVFCPLKLVPDDLGFYAGDVGLCQDADVGLSILPPVSSLRSFAADTPVFEGALLYVTHVSQPLR